MGVIYVLFNPFAYLVKEEVTFFHGCLQTFSLNIGLASLHFDLEEYNFCFETWCKTCHKIKPSAILSQERDKYSTHLRYLDASQSIFAFLLTDLLPLNWACLPTKSAATWYLARFWRTQHSLSIYDGNAMLGHLRMRIAWHLG